MKNFLLKTILLLCTLVGGTGASWAETVTLVSGSGTSGYAVPEGWTSSGTVEGGSYLKLDNGTITSPAFDPHTGLSFTYSVATFGGGTNHPLTIRILNASTNAVIVEKTTDTPTSSSYISTGSPISLGDINVNFKIQLYAPSGKGIRLRNYSVTGTPASGGSELENSNLALTGAPIALNFDLYNNASAQVINYTTSSTGAVTIADSEYATFSINESAKTITVTPTAVTPSAQTITVNQAADATYKAGSATFTLTITDSTPIPTHTVTFSVNGATTTDEVEEGAAITFPSNPANVNGKKFVGWTTSIIDGTTNVAPDFVTSANMGNADITYYAVFAAVVAGSEEDESIIIDADQNATNFPTSYASANDYTLSGVSFNILQGYKNGAKLQWRAEGNSNGTGTMYNKGALKKIQSIVLTYDSSDSNKNFTIKIGDSANPTSGTAITPTVNNLIYTFNCSSYNKDYFVMTNGSGAGYLTSIVINYKSGTPDSYSDYCTTVVAAAVEKPTITVAENPFLFSTTATITCETEGAATKYSYDGETWNDYSSALTITETKTIYAKAVKNEVESSVASVTATKNLATPTVAVSGDLTLDLNGETNVDAGTLTAAVTYNEAAVEGATVTWSSNNTDVATIVESTGAVTIKTCGTVTFTATYAGNSDYAEATGTKTVTVVDSQASGGSGNPYTVAQAIDATPKSGTSASVYIRGIVSAFYNTSIVGDGSNYRYYISDDGTTTTQLLVYKGKKNSTDNFSDESDLQIGDVVTIYGGLTTYNSTKEVASGNYIVSLSRKAESDLTLTSSAEVKLEKTSAVMNPTSTITWTTNSTGTMTFTSSDELVATVTNAGVITAVGEGSATITFSQEADKDYKASTDKTVTVTVTDNRSACATGIDLTSAKTITKGDGPTALSATSTKADGFTGEITYTYDSADASIFSITDGNYTGAGVGATTVTVFASPTGGNAANYKAATQVVDVQVNGTNSISLDLTSKTQDFSAGAFNIAATVPTENYDGAVTAVSDNPAVATVSVVGTTVTVTPKAAGEAKITVTAGTGTYYPATASKTCSVTVTAPEGGTTAPDSEQTIFNETFNTNEGTGGNDDSWKGSIASADFKADNDWTTTNAKGADACAKFGTSSAGGSATTPDINLEDGVLYTLTFKAGAWDKTGEGTSLSLSAENATIRNEANTADVSSVTISLGKWTSYTLKLIVTDDSDPVNITFSTSGSNKRFFLDEVKVTKHVDPSEIVTLNKYGYATYCSVNPMDFTSTTGYTAWRVSEITSTGTITFVKITGKIKGGQGVLLYNANADGVNTSDVTVAFADGDTEFDDSENKFIGTTSPVYVAAETVYGLSGNKFVINKAAGTIGAKKAYLNATSIPAGVQEFTFMFEDETTGITETRTVTREEVEGIFNLAGQRLSRTQKGINIVNGKKYIKK